MPDIFLCTGDAAEEHSQEIQSMEGSFLQMPDMGGGRTNLPVMTTMAEMCANITEVNNAYKELLSKDAVAITDSKHVYEELDQKLSNCMGIK